MKSSSTFEGETPDLGIQQPNYSPKDILTQEMTHAEYNIFRESEEEYLTKGKTYDQSFQLIYLMNYIFRDMFTVPNRKAMEVVIHFLFVTLNKNFARETFR